MLRRLDTLNVEGSVVCSWTFYPAAKHTDAFLWINIPESTLIHKHTQIHTCTHCRAHKHVQSKDAPDCVKQALKSSSPSGGIGEKRASERAERRRKRFPSQAKCRNKCIVFQSENLESESHLPRDARGLLFLAICNFKYISMGVCAHMHLRQICMREKDSWRKGNRERWKRGTVEEKETE